MIAPLLLGSFIIIVNMGIQTVAVVLMVRYLMSKTGKDAAKSKFATDIKMIPVVLMVLFVGHLIQFAVWAGLFVYIGEFESFNTAFYHSTVNFSSAKGSAERGSRTRIVAVAWYILVAVSE